jgi:hypothetical protein
MLLSQSGLWILLPQPIVIGCFNIISHPLLLIQMSFIGIVLDEGDPSSCAVLQQPQYLDLEVW